MGVSLRFSISFSTLPSMSLSVKLSLISERSLTSPSLPSSFFGNVAMIPHTSRMITAPIPPSATILLLSVFVMASRIAGCMSGRKIRKCSPENVAWYV